MHPFLSFYTNIDATFSSGLLEVDEDRVVFVGTVVGTAAVNEAFTLSYSSVILMAIALMELLYTGVAFYILCV